MEVEHMLDHQNGQKIKHVCVYYYSTVFKKPYRHFFNLQI